MIELPSPMPWHDEAACQGHPIEWWFPAIGHATAPTTRKAHAICAECPVRTECLEHAVMTPEPHGIWGGTSERERRRLRRTWGIRRRCGRCGREFAARSQAPTAGYCCDECRNAAKNERNATWRRRTA